MTSTAVLVHGTFARGAPWTASESPLACEIRHALGAEGQTEQFEWCGSNSYQARERAAELLATKLDEITSRPGQHRTVVVAHSHGGNIALQAIRKMKGFPRVSAIVTLGTPFITVEPRKWAPPLLYAISFTAWLTLLIGWVGIGALALYFPLRRAKNEAAQLHLVDHHLNAGDTPHLIVRHGLDEASLWLKLLVIPRLLDSPMTLLGKIFIGSNWLTKIPWIVGASVLFVTILGIRFVPFLDIFLIGTVAILLLAPPLSAISTLVYSHKFGFGGRPSLRSIFIQVQAATEMRYAHMRRFSGLLGISRTLMFRPLNFSTPHALGYSDPKCIRAIGDWLRIQCPPSRTERQDDQAPSLLHREAQSL